MDIYKFSAGFNIIDTSNIDIYIYLMKNMKKSLHLLKKVYCIGS